MVRAVVSRLPQFPLALACAEIVNLSPIGAGDVDAALEGKVLRVVVRDAGATVTLRRLRSRFVPALASAPADVTIAATLRDFALLAARREDPDTLFFGRRLTIEGDTEAGLALKNLIDSADLSAFAAWVDTAAKVAARLQRLLPFH